MTKKEENTIKLMNFYESGYKSGYRKAFEIFSKNIVKTVKYGNKIEKDDKVFRKVIMNMIDSKEVLKNMCPYTEKVHKQFLKEMFKAIDNID